jgi:hypothetical protein
VADGKAARRDALETLEKCRLRLLTAGTAFADASEIVTQGLFELSDQALVDSPKHVLQGGAALWVRAHGALDAAGREACQALTGQYAPGPPRPGIVDGRLTFVIDQYSQATDPFRTEISITEDVDVQAPRTSGNPPLFIPIGFFGFSRASDDGGTWLVSLAGLGNLLWTRPDGDYDGALVWSTGTLPVRVVFRRST